MQRLATALALLCLTFTPAKADEILRVPIPGHLGGMVTRLCMPEGATKAPLAVINHGSPANAAERAQQKPWACTSQAARFFLERGYAVAFPVRRGYGETGGDWVEAYGTCQMPDYVKGGKGTAADIAAAIQFLHSQPGITPGRTLVIGHSAGGFGTMALAANPPTGVIGLINVAGGRGGRSGSARDNSTCSPQKLIEAAGTFGTTARKPMLWLYANNDSFFSPDLAKAMHSAFTKAGGVARLETVPAFGEDGHRLFGGGGREVWGPVVTRYLATLR